MVPIPVLDERTRTGAKNLLNRGPVLVQPNARCRGGREGQGRSNQRTLFAGDARRRKKQDPDSEHPNLGHPPPAPPAPHRTWISKISVLYRWDSGPPCMNIVTVRSLSPAIVLKRIFTDQRLGLRFCTATMSREARLKPTSSSGYSDTALLISSAESLRPIVKLSIPRKSLAMKRASNFAFFPIAGGRCWLALGRFCGILVFVV